MVCVSKIRTVVRCGRTRPTTAVVSLFSPACIEVWVYAPAATRTAWRLRLTDCGVQTIPVAISEGFHLSQQQHCLSMQVVSIEAVEQDLVLYHILRVAAQALDLRRSQTLPVVGQ